MGWAGGGAGLLPVSDDEALLQERIYKAPQPWYAVYATRFSRELDDALAAKVSGLITVDSWPLRFAHFPDTQRAAIEAISGVEKVARLSDPRRVAVVSGLHAVTAVWDRVMDGLYPNGNVGASDVPWGSVPSYPTFPWRGSRALRDDEREHRLPTPRGACVALNLSIAPGDLFDFRPYDDWDPVNVATRHLASRFCVVVAAGNYPGGRPAGLQRMNPWAEAPHVIAVGATGGDDEERDLADYSLIGQPEGPQPTVVADGTDLFDPSGQPGTSFAAPKVAGYLLVLAAFVSVIAEAWRSIRFGSPHGIPLVGRASVDIGFRRDRLLEFRDKHMPALPFAGVDRGVLVDAARSKLIPPDLHITWSPTILRSMLTECAVPVRERVRHEVGFGYVGEEQLLEYLCRFGVADLVRLFGESGSRIAPTENTPLGIRQQLVELVQLWRRSALVVGWDLALGRIVTNFREKDPGEA